MQLSTLPWLLSTVLFCLLLITGQPSAAQALTAQSFAAKGLPLLPPEPRYAYHEMLHYGPIHRPRRDAQARAASGEMMIPASGWKLIIAVDAGVPLQQAASDFQDYLHTSMQIRVNLEKRGSLADWPTSSGAILAGTREELPGCGKALHGSKDYQILTSKDRIVICGFDALGASYGLYHLEARMNLREGPFLPLDTDIARRSLYRARMVLSWLGWMDWPDTYLAHLAHDGFDSIFASVYANPNGAPNPPVSGDDFYSMLMHHNKKQDPSRVRDLIDRASRYGIRIYAPIIYRFMGDAHSEAGLRSLVRDIVTRFPEIRGYILLTEGFYYDGWFGAGGHGARDLKEWARHWSRAVAIVAEECHKINPRIEVLPWDYNIDFRPQNAELKRYVLSILPRDTIPLLTWENGKSFELDGLRGHLRDYAVSQVGPAEVSEAQIAEARRRGMRVYVNADTFASQQFGTIPYIPCPYQWHKRYEALQQYGVEGTLESWSNGYKPNIMAELRCWYSWSEAPPLDTLLRAVARRDFGPRSENDVLSAWDHFSKAIRLVPDTIPSMGTINAVANPLFLQKPEPRAMTLEHSWRDPDKWQGYLGANVNPYWPYSYSWLLFFPDFTNRTNRAESYAARASGIEQNEDQARKRPVLPVFNKYLLLAADEFERGLLSYRAAALNAPLSKRRGAVREVMVAEQIQRMLRSSHAVLEFEDLRFRLSHTNDRSERNRIFDRMASILKDEIQRTQASLEAVRRDSRLGYFFEQDYVYTPYVLREKLALLRTTLDEELPALRKRNQ